MSKPAFRPVTKSDPACIREFFDLSCRSSPFLFLEFVFGIVVVLLLIRVSREKKAYFLTRQGMSYPSSGDQSA